MAKERKRNGNIHPTRKFKTPEELFSVWLKYKEDLKKQASEWLKIQYVGKEGMRVSDEFKLPLTFEGFEVFSYDNGFGLLNQYFSNKEGYYNDFVEICSRIKNEIRTNQITGGMLGIFNPSITQRLNNLHEVVKTEATQKIKVLEIDPLSNESNDNA